MAGSLLEQYATSIEKMESAEIRNSLTIIVTVTKTMLPHHMSQQEVIKAHIHIAHQDHNVSFRKPLLDCL